MSRPFIATILAAAIAVISLSARPAAAADVEKLIFGALTLAIIGTTLEAQNRERREVVIHRAPPRAHKPAPGVVQRAILPEYCLRTVRSDKGPRMIYGNRCMRDNYRAYSRLPDACRVRITGPDGTRRGFKPGCLYRAGFRG